MNRNARFEIDAMVYDGDVWRPVTQLLLVGDQVPPRYWVSGMPETERSLRDDAMTRFVAGVRSSLQGSRRQLTQVVRRHVGAPETLPVVEVVLDARRTLMTIVASRAGLFRVPGGTFTTYPLAVDALLARLTADLQHLVR